MIILLAKCRIFDIRIISREFILITHVGRGEDGQSSFENAMSNSERR